MEQQQSTKFVVIALKKDGTPRKVTSFDYKWCSRGTYEEAMTYQTELQRMNPKTSYTILEVTPDLRTLTCL